MVGIFDCVCRQRRFDGDFVFAKSLRREAMVSAKALSYPYVEDTRSCRGTRELEDHSLEPVASVVSHQSAELFLWTDANSVSHLYAVGVDRSYAWPFLLRIHGNTGATCSAHHARQKLPANTRVLDLGRRVHNNRVALDSVGPPRASGDSNATGTRVQQNPEGSVRA